LPAGVPAAVVLNGELYLANSHFFQEYRSQNPEFRIIHAVQDF
jgi:hypothetical protein